MSQQIIFALILAGTLVLFISEKVRIDLAAMLALLALALTGILTPAEALSGFASEPAIIVAAVFVISAALNATGLTERMGNLIARAAGGSEWRATLVVMPAVAAMAALSHHLMITAMMLPILIRFGRENQLSPSRLLMPMSLAASLGTTLTLFSAPAFLLMNQLLIRGGEPRLDVFAITPIGAALIAIAVLYMLASRWMLPKHSAQSDRSEYLQLDRYYTELVVVQNSRWAGKPLVELTEHFKERLSVAEWLRNGVRQRHAANEAILQAGDVLLVNASPDEIASMADEPGLELHAVAKYGDAAEEGDAEREEQQLVQVVVAPQSRFIGRTIAGIDFLKRLRVVVVGVWRQQGWMHEEMSQLELKEGDILVLRGTSRTFSELAMDRGFLMLVPFAARQRRRHRAALAASIVAAVIVASATGVTPVHIAFLAGAVALVLFGCVRIEQAYREIDVRIFVMIAGVIPLGLAMEKTGTAAALAAQLQQVTMNWESISILLALFWSAAIVTQVLSDSATVVLLGPISFALATALNLPPQPFLVCTALGAVAAFLTPIGHHGNLLILNPGQYTFGDFLRIGIPLTVLISLITVWMAQWLWLGGQLLPF
jgi:di/tricarboxylate transporter